MLRHLVQNITGIYTGHAACSLSVITTSLSGADFKDEYMRDTFGLKGEGVFDDRVFMVPSCECTDRH